VPFDVSPLKNAYALAKRRVEDRYQVPVIVTDVVDPNTGDFDGLRILIDYNQDLDAALFVLIHLFGHTVQWNTSATWREVGLDTSPGKSEAALARIREYELDATRYGLTLLHDCGLNQLDRWASDWWHADWAYLQHYYRTGEKLEFRTFLKPNAGELLTPLAVPPFRPQSWGSRWSF